MQRFFSFIVGNINARVMIFDFGRLWGRVTSKTMWSWVWRNLFFCLNWHFGPSGVYWPPGDHGRHGVDKLFSTKRHIGPTSVVYFRTFSPVTKTKADDMSKSLIQVRVSIKLTKPLSFAYYLQSNTVQMAHNILFNFRLFEW